MPLPNFHSARIKNPDDFVRIVQLQELPNGIRILGGPLKSDPDGSGKPQAYRFPKAKFTVAEAKTWLDEHDIKFTSFEPAEPTKSSEYSDLLPKYIKNLSKKEADIFLFDQIGGGGISGQEFADEIKMLNEFGVEQINVHINSGGGSVMDGFSIFSAMTNSKATIHTINEGVAGSMAGIILMGGDKVSMFDFAKVMIHNPTGSDDPDENEQNAINALKDSLVVILKNRTNKTGTEISKMMDAETWLTAKEALAAGFIDEIVSSKHKEKEKSTRKSQLEIANILNLTNNTTMKTVCDFLNLSHDATENSILDAIKKITSELATEKKEHETTQGKLKDADDIVIKQKAKIDKFDEKQAELNKKLVEDTVETAIKDGKVDEKQKDELIDKFKNDADGLKLVLGALKSTAPNIKNQLSTGDIEDKDIPEDRKSWGLREWMKEDQKGIDNIRNNNPELYAKMYLKEYGVEYKAA